MANNVFGNPVTDQTVQQIFIGITNITAQHRAEVALRYMNADTKANQATDFVNELKRSYGNGTSTLATIYNATGGTLTFIRSHTWEGNVWRHPYPQILQNGQWGAFLHVRGRLMGPSKEAIVYRGSNNDGAARDWMLAWNTSRMQYQNRVYTEIRAAGNFGSVNWGTIDSAMNGQTLFHSMNSLGCFSTVQIGAGSSPHFVGIMTLDGVNASNLALASDVSAIFPSLDSQYQDEDDEGVDDPSPAAVAATTTASE